MVVTRVRESGTLYSPSNYRCLFGHSWKNMFYFGVKCMGKTFSQLISLVKAKPVVHAKRGVRNELASCYLEFAQKYLKDQMVVVVSGIFPSVPT